jgi:hypothetical protein
MTKGHMKTSPQIASLYSLTARVVRQPLPPVSVASALFALAVLLSTPAFAATRTTSLLVSMTVEPSCQVSSTLTSSANGSPAATGQGSPVSMSCSIPVPYQMNVSNGSRVEVAGLVSLSPVVASLPGYASSRAANSLPAQDGPTQAAGDDNHGLAGLLAAESMAASDGSAQAIDPGAVVVSIVY